MNLRQLFVTLLMPLFLAMAADGAVNEQPVSKEKAPADFTDAADWFRQGLEHNRAGRYRQAADAFRKVVAITPADAAAGSHRSAPVAALKQAVRLNPDFLPAYSNLAAICSKLGRFREALDAYDQVLRLKPDDANTRFNRGIAYKALGDMEAALKEYELLKPLDGELAAKLLEAITR